MVKNWMNDSGSDSESKGSPSPNQSDDEVSQSGARSRSRSRSHSRTPSRSASRSRSNTPTSHTSRSRSHSRTPSNASQKSGSRSRSGSQHSNRSASPNGSHHSKSRSRSKSGSKSRSVSRSPSQKAQSRSRSVSRSPSQKAKSVSRSPSQKAKSRSRSGSRSPSQKAKSRSRSGSRSPSQKAKSRSRSGSRSPSQKAKSRSRSASRHSNSDSDVGGDKRKRQVLSDSGSDAERAQPKKKKSALIDSDSEPENAAPAQDEEDVDAADIFGDADDISTDEEGRHEKGKSPSSSVDDVRRGSDNEDDRRRRRSSGSDDERRMSDDETEGRRKEKEPEPEPVPERRIDVEIPRIVSDLGKELHFVKLPNFLSVETRPFDPDTYEDEIDEEETLDEEGRQRIKLKVSNTIRWRDYLDDYGNQVKESNARMVRWSDGSMSLHLGNEIFDVYRQPLQGDHNHLFIRQGTGLQGQAVFRTKLTFRPHSTESFTHKKMTMSLADRSQKTSGIKILTTVGSDPDANRYVKLKKEEEQLRQAMRQKSTQNKPKRSRDTAASLSAGYREEHDSDDEGAISIAAIKNKYTGKGASAAPKSGAAIYSSDEDDSDFETRRGKKTDKNKVLRALADSDDESGGQNTGSGGDTNENDSKSGSDSD